VCEGGCGPIGDLHGIRQRPLGNFSLLEVTSDLGQAPLPHYCRLSFQRVTCRQVESPLAARGQFPVQALLREVVIKGVEVAPRFAYQPRGYGIIQRTFDLHFGTTIDLLQIIKNKGMTQDTCFLQESLRFLTQVREPLAHHRSHTLGDLNLFEGSPAPASVLAIHVTALDQGPHYLLYEEGVALGMGMQQRGKLL